MATMLTNARLFVETQRRLTPPKYGLFSAAALTEGETHVFAGGVEYFLPIDPTAVGHTALECLDEGTAMNRDIPRGLPAGVGDPFEVYAGAQCDITGTSEAELRQRAVDTLQAGEMQAVERRIWRDENPAIMDATNTVEVVDVAAPLALALGRLEHWLYTDYASAGVLHLPRFLGALADSLDLVQADGTMLRTKLGTPVVFGDYPNVGPDGTAPTAGSVWIAATGDLLVRRTSVDALTDKSQSWFDPTTNNATAIVVRDYLVTFDEVAGAALVDLP
ncbi:hypothetical protein J1765_gp21 [Gordonia phage Gaea]|uniref:Major capsid protein n=2 Tax=Kroosvirus TaxID=2948789 RepID=A0A7G8LM71_9CAUD|nr:hypothetical protein J1763_gp22 [Gordonia phage YorkOnyx]YP_010001899.1 hypothetical protein J1765_gp21 [Gordonia phage Gaea]AYR02829.1 hypothetical protein SEA_GAEA_21 [Gordonia phage Gaea]QNJ58343.1 hypothetical protein SEA_YORKONYX_22 [Gordonia phage YorkOnyx]